MAAVSVAMGPAPRRAVAANRPLWAWVLIGVLGYLLLPWYAQQDANGLLAVGLV